jgi:hypothetical protein
LFSHQARCIASVCDLPGLHCKLRTRLRKQLSSFSPLAVQQLFALLVVFTKACQLCLYCCCQRYSLLLLLLLHSC